MEVHFLVSLSIISWREESLLLYVWGSVLQMLEQFHDLPCVNEHAFTDGTYLYIFIEW